MAYLNRTQVEAIVADALRSVADFSGDIENYSFTHFQETHEQLFLNSLKEKLNDSPYYLNSGGTSVTKYYDVPLSMELLNGWQTMKDCIDYVENNQTVKDKS